MRRRRSSLLVRSSGAWLPRASRRASDVCAGLFFAVDRVRKLLPCTLSSSLTARRGAQTRRSRGRADGDSWAPAGKRTRAAARTPPPSARIGSAMDSADGATGAETAAQLAKARTIGAVGLAFVLHCLQRQYQVRALQRVLKKTDNPLGAAWDHWRQTLTDASHLMLAFCCAQAPATNKVPCRKRVLRFADQSVLW